MMYLMFKLGIVEGNGLIVEGAEIENRTLPCPFHEPKLLFPIGNLVQKIFNNLHPQARFDIIVSRISFPLR